MASNCPSQQVNADVAGIGVRISFYLQTLFLGCLTVRSSSLDDIVGSMYTLIATNMAMVMATLILAFGAAPEIALQDALVVLYLLSMSWLTVTLSLASCTNRFSSGTTDLQVVSVIQTYMIFGLVCSVLVSASYFGNPACNITAKVVILRPFSFFEAGRIIGSILLGVCFLGYTAILLNDLRKKIRQLATARKSQTNDIEKQDVPPVKPEQAPAEPVIIPQPLPAPKRMDSIILPSREAHQTDKDGELVAFLLLILIECGFCILNTELLIHWNFDDSENNSSRSWQFGQILPMFLVVLPFVNVVKSFRMHGLRSFPQDTRFTHMRL